MRKVLSISKSNSSSKPSKLEILCEQLLDSVIVGGITALSTYVSVGGDATWKSAAIAFGLTFLIKLKEYRKIE